MIDDIILSNLIGLVGAKSNNDKTLNTDNIIIDALSFRLRNNSFNNEDTIDIVNKIINDKNTISTSCQSCLCPCGNTSAYDMNRFNELPKKKKELKLRLIEGMEALAYECFFNRSFNIELLYKGIAYFSYDIDDNLINELIEQIDKELERLKNEKKNN